MLLLRETFGHFEGRRPSPKLLRAFFFFKHKKLSVNIAIVLILVGAPRTTGGFLTLLIIMTLVE